MPRASRQTLSLSTQQLSQSSLALRRQATSSHKAKGGGAKPGQANDMPYIDQTTITRTSILPKDSNRKLTTSNLFYFPSPLSLPTLHLAISDPHVSGGSPARTLSSKEAKEEVR